LPFEIRLRDDERLPSDRLVVEIYAYLAVTPGPGEFGDGAASELPVSDPRTDRHHGRILRLVFRRGHLGRFALSGTGLAPFQRGSGRRTSTISERAHSTAITRTRAAGSPGAAPPAA